MQGKHRIIHLIPAQSLQSAIEQVSFFFNSNQLTIIDTTSDFNQNRWLGLEINHTLIYFDAITPINHLLSIFGCITGGSHVILAYHPNISRSYFKSHILIPKLNKQAKSLYSPQERQTTPVTLSTAEQHIIQQLINTTTPIQLIGKRGTGKSTLLGYCIKALLTANHKVILSSPSKKSSMNTLRQLSDVSRETFIFSSPKNLTHHLSDNCFVIIDEAASISKQYIETAIQISGKNKSPLILATTIEGYEGTGQSYRLNYLNDAAEKVIVLSEPKRFPYDDPLERISHALCHPTPQYHPLADGIYAFNTQELRKNALTEACYALLQTAHYKTSPNDLARFYDEPAEYIVYLQKNKLIAAVHAHIEQLPKNISNQSIYNGTRRCKNALTQQAIIQSYGITTIYQSKILRIDRIATDAKYRRKGIATAMLNQLKRRAISQGYDFISTSFSASPINRAFWQAQHFTPARIGLYPNKWHNQYSLLMLLPLNEHSALVNSELSKRFYQHIQYYNTEIPQWIKQALPQQTITNEISLTSLSDSIKSVINYHRDIHWLLPELEAYKTQLPRSQQSRLNALLTGKRLKKSEINTAKQELTQLLQQIKHLPD